GAVFFLITLWACEPETVTPSPFSFEGQTMGTTYRVTVHVPEGVSVDPDALKKSVDQRLLEVNQAMSTYIADSELSQFNRSQESAFAVSKSLASVVALATQVSRNTKGAFDVTVMPLVDLWGFGPTKRTPRVPSAEQIESTRKGCGFQKLSVSGDGKQLRKSIPTLRVDLSAIAKGYGVDEIVRLLLKSSIRNAFVEIGGEVRVLGHRDGHSVPWRVGVEEPAPTLERSVRKVVPLSVDLAMATSGSYRNFFDADGKKYSHTIDPRTGRPVEHSTVSATVISRTCAEADALATAMMVLGSKRGYDLAEKLGLSVIFLDEVGGTVSERVSPAAVKYLAASAKPAKGSSESR
ncbi:MAG: FAD:protein FMN transferase, partial [Planctomycetota bacterium]